MNNDSDEIDSLESGTTEEENLRSGESSVVAGLSPTNRALAC
jgi:hypothetical protein